jgi:flagellar protein FliO/FliZ
MDISAYLRFVAALIFVLALMGGLWLTLKRLGLTGPVIPPGVKRRLKVIESVAIDSRRRAILLQRDDTQHLVILGPTGETVVETNIAPPAPDAQTSHDTKTI